MLRLVGSREEEKSEKEMKMMNDEENSYLSALVLNY